MNILIVAAHPDDEALGCGGTIARHAAAGERVDILFLADGASARPGAGADEIEARRRAARAAAAALGAQPPEFLDFPDNRLDIVPLLTVVQAVEAVVGRARPAIVYTHHAGDLNIDHRIANQATLTACRPLPGATVRAIYSFEVLSSTEWASHLTGFWPTRYVDIGSHLEAKMAALRLYRAEMRPFPHPRSFEAVAALAKLRGTAVGLAAAEAFMTIREIST
ncbi:MAG: PIG-L deacetylase family protein [Pseudomonadota bacterium]